MLSERPKTHRVFARTCLLRGTNRRAGINFRGAGQLQALSGSFCSVEHLVGGARLSIDRQSEIQNPRLRKLWTRRICADLG